MHVLLDALARLRQRGSTAHVVIVGGAYETEPQYAKRLQSDCQRLGLEGHVTFTGAVAHERIASYVAASDVMVHASRREPFGIVVLEAMAAGKPLVASSCGGPAEVVVDGQHGLLSDFGDAAMLAEKLEYLLTHPAQAAAMGQAARERVRHFTVQTFARRVTQAVQMSLDPPPAGIYLDGSLVDPDLPAASAYGVSP